MTDATDVFFEERRKPYMFRITVYLEMGSIRSISDVDFIGPME